jgi:hypothetical protein
MKVEKSNNANERELTCYNRKNERMNLTLADL